MLTHALCTHIELIVRSFMHFILYTRHFDIFLTLVFACVFILVRSKVNNRNKKLCMFVCLF